MINRQETQEVVTSALKKEIYITEIKYTDLERAIQDQSVTRVKEVLKAQKERYEANHKKIVDTQTEKYKAKLPKFANLTEQQLDKKNEEVEKIDEEKRTVTAKCEFYKGKVADMVETLGENEKLNNEEVDVLRSKYNRSKEEIVRIQKKYEAAKQLIHKLTEDKQNIMAELDKKHREAKESDSETLKRELAKIKTENRTLTNQLSYAYNKFRELEIESKNAELKEVTEKLKRLVDQLKDKLECPVCLEVPRSGPVSVCPNGHLVCAKCRTESCPTCRTPMGTSRSLLAVTVIENIGHDCLFDECGELFTTDKLEDHAKICQHRTVTCPYELCMEDMSLAKLLDHMVESDCCLNSDPIVIGKSLSSTLDFMAPDSEESDWTWKQIIYSFENVILVISPQVVDDFYFFPVVLFASEKECINYKVEVVVHEINSSSEDREVSFKFCGQPTSIDESKLHRKYLGLTVSKFGIAKILKKSKDREFSLSFKIVKTA